MSMTVCMLCALMNACLPGPSALPVRHSNDAQAINAANAAHLRKSGWLIADKNQPVAALAFQSGDPSLLLAAYHPDKLRRWNITSRALEAEFDTYSVSVGATVFDREGKYLVTTDGTKTPAYNADIDGVRMWDAHTGEMLAGRLGIEGLADVAISADGRWIVGVEGAGIDIWDTKSFQQTENLITSHEESSFMGMSAVAFDPVGEYIVVAGRNGIVSYNRVSAGRTTSHLVHLQRPTVRYAGLPISRPVEIAVDPARRWIALVVDEFLMVWSFQSEQLHLVSRVGATAVASLAFNSTGDLLVVGSERGWEIWDIAQRRRLLTEAGVPIYAAVFSPDDRQLVLGDAVGVIYLWSLPGK